VGAAEEQALGEGVHEALDALVFKMGSVLLSSAVLALWIAGGDMGSLPPFTAFGALSGVLFTAAVGTNTLALARMPVSLNTGLWGGVSVVVSFAWGVLALGDELVSPAGAALGIALLVAGTLGVVSADGAADEEGDGASTGIADVTGARDTWWGMAKEDVPVCLGLSLLAGLWSGSVLVPLHYSAVKGAGFVPSLAMGALGSALLLATTAACLLPRDAPLPGALAAFPPVPRSWPHEWTPARRRLLGAAGVAGVIWTAGDVLTIMAIGEVGFSVVYPSTHTPLIAGLWGLLVFGDFDRPTAPPAAAKAAAGADSVEGDSAWPAVGPGVVVAAAAAERLPEQALPPADDDGGNGIGRAATIFFASGVSILGGAFALASSILHN
jgi:glucose uptake protein GlcU